MFYSGWLLSYTVNGTAKIEGPISTYEEAKKKYDDLALLSPVVSDRRIGRMVVNPCCPTYNEF